MKKTQGPTIRKPIHGLARRHLTTNQLEKSHKHFSMNSSSITGLSLRRSPLCSFLSPHSDQKETPEICPGLFHHITDDYWVKDFLCGTFAPAKKQNIVCSLTTEAHKLLHLVYSVLKSINNSGRPSLYPLQQCHNKISIIMVCHSEFLFL